MRRNVLVGVGALLGLGVIGALAGGNPNSTPAPSQRAAIATSKTTLAPPTETPVAETPVAETSSLEAPSAEATPVDPDLAFELYKQAFETTALDLFKTDVADALEADFYWVNSIDRTTYDAERNMLRYEASIAFESVYNRDLEEWKSDTWELFSNFARDLWVPYMEGFGDEIGGLTPDWARWTPRLRLQGNKGRLVADCPGRVMYAMSQREATQVEFSKDCTFKQ